MYLMTVMPSATPPVGAGADVTELQIDKFLRRVAFCVQDRQNAFWLPALADGAGDRSEIIRGYWNKLGIP